MRHALIAGLIGLVSLNLHAATPPVEVIYPDDHPRYAEYIEILKTALDKTVPEYGAYVMHTAEIKMNETRFLAEAHLGKRVNVVWSATSDEKEKQLLPIRIPLSKGLLGYRIALIRAAQQKKLDSVHNLDDLRQLKFGLGPGWGDVSVYKAAGLPVLIAEYEDLFKMLSFGRFDLFSRGVNEIFSEYQAQKGNLPNLAIEQHLLLYYPYPFYLFVSPQTPALAERIERGMRIMLDDGSFDAIFRKHNRVAIQQADMKHRRIINISNKLLPSKTPLSDARLWYKPGN